MLKLLEHRESDWSRCASSGATKPIYGTCAGAILLAREVTHPAQASLDLMDIAVERNAYGRQIDSRIAQVPMDGWRRAGSGLHPRAHHPPRGRGRARSGRYQGDPVWVEQGRHMVTTFHPELTDDPRIHRQFVEKL